MLCYAMRAHMRRVGSWLVAPPPGGPASRHPLAGRPAAHIRVPRTPSHTRTHRTQQRHARTDKHARTLADCAVFFVPFTFFSIKLSCSSSSSSSSSHKQTPSPSSLRTACKDSSPERWHTGHCGAGYLYGQAPCLCQLVGRTSGA